MPRATAFALALFGLALAGLAVWVLDLSGRVGTGPAGPGPRPAPPGAGGDGLAARLDALEARLDEVSAEVARIRERPAPSAGAPAGGGTGDAAPVPAGLEEAVEAVLRKREEEARMAEIRRRAERFVMRLDPDVKLTEAKRWEVLPVMTDWFDRRDRILRSRHLEDREREAAVEALDADRDARLREILSPEEVRGVLQRLHGNVPLPAEGDPERGRGEGVDGMPPR